MFLILSNYLCLILFFHYMSEKRKISSDYVGEFCMELKILWIGEKLIEDILYKNTGLFYNKNQM